MALGYSVGDTSCLGGNAIDHDLVFSRTMKTCPFTWSLAVTQLLQAPSLGSAPAGLKIARTIFDPVLIFSPEV